MVKGIHRRCKYTSHVLLSVAWESGLQSTKAHTEMKLLVFHVLLFFFLPVFIKDVKNLWIVVTSWFYGMANNLWRIWSKISPSGTHWGGLKWATMKTKWRLNVARSPFLWYLGIILWNEFNVLKLKLLLFVFSFISKCILFQLLFEIFWNFLHLLPFYYI